MRRRFGEEDYWPTFGGENFGGEGGPVNWMHPGGKFAGRGPRNYKRSDERILEDINERLTRDSMIDAFDIDVSVQDGVVWGVKDIHNQLRIKPSQQAA